MTEQTELVRQAKAISIDERKKILASLKETELHKHIKELLVAMDPESVVEITHGSEEHGNDLVRVRKDIFGESITGIIVKVGKIGGKTAGKVDEVKSQIEQSIAHPVRLKTRPDVLFVSEVWVMLAGELSKTAHIRLERERQKRNVKIIGLDSLTENFTDYYPQVFFEGKIMDFFQKKIQELEEKYTFSARRGRNLSEYFVEPLVAVIDIPATFDEENFALILQKQRVPFSRFKTIFQHNIRVILAGDPGVGKTMALTKFVIDGLREAWDLATRKKLGKQTGIPILIPAKDFLQFTDVKALLAEYLLFAEEIMDRLKISAILIDALDEVPPAQRDEVLKRAVDFSQQLTATLVITSRKIDLIKNPPPGFKRYELLPFEFGQALEFFRKLVTDVKILDTLKDGLEKVKYQIPMTPLSLLLLIEIAENEKELPASLAELFDRFSDIALGRYDREKGIEVLFEYLIKKRFLAELALKELLEKQRLEIPAKEFEEFLSNYARLYDWGEDALKGFVKEIERAGILDLGEAVAFQHRSFLDYFAAFRISDKWEEFENLEDFIVQIYFDDFWGDVTPFYIGLRRDIRVELLSKIFEFQKEGLIANIEKFLSGRLLQAAWHSPTEIKYWGIEKAIGFAPAVREEFLGLVDKSKVPVPRIFSDVLVMALSELSFESRFLLKETERLFDSLSGQPDQKISYQMLSLLWGIHKLLPSNELSGMIDSVLDTMSKVPDLSQEQEALTFLLLVVIEQKEKGLAKSLKRNLNKLSRKYPEVFRELLPPRPKGFRRGRRAT